MNGGRARRSAAGRGSVGGRERECVCVCVEGSGDACVEAGDQGCEGRAGYERRRALRAVPPKTAARAGGRAKGGGEARDA